MLWWYTSNSHFRETLNMSEFSINIHLKRKCIQCLITTCALPCQTGLTGWKVYFVDLNIANIYCIMKTMQKWSLHVRFSQIFLIFQHMIQSLLESYHSSMYLCPCINIYRRSSHTWYSPNYHNHYILQNDRCNGLRSLSHCSSP